MELRYGNLRNSLFRHLATRFFLPRSYQMILPAISIISNQVHGRFGVGGGHCSRRDERRLRPAQLPSKLFQKPSFMDPASTTSVGAAINPVQKPDGLLKLLGSLVVPDSRADRRIRQHGLKPASTCRDRGASPCIAQPAGKSGAAVYHWHDRTADRRAPE